MKKRHTIALTTAGILALSLVAGTAVASGDQTDPLITLSYLEESVTPQLTESARTQAQAIAEDLDQRFEAELSALETEFKASSGSNSNSTHQFQLVSLSKNQSITLDLGTQVVLRIGTASVSASSSPALINLTSGGSLETDQELSMNHLYLATISGRKITATDASTKLMVYGDYTKN